MKLTLLILFALSSSPCLAAGWQSKGGQVSGRAISEQNQISYCAGYIDAALANRLKPEAQRDANTSCRSGRAVRSSGWDIDCVNGYTVVGADFTCR